MDFVTLESNCNGRIVEQHFREWGNAEKELQEKVKRILTLHPTAKKVTDVDDYNADKGFAVRYVEIECKDEGLAWRISISENYFWD